MSDHHQPPQGDPVTRAAQVEELRFAKRQQWSIAASALTLLAAIFGIAQAIKPNFGERIAATVLIVCVVGFADAYLYQLQSHLRRTREFLDPIDRDAWLRGVDIVRVLAGTVFVSGLIVAYLLWFHPDKMT